MNPSGARIVDVTICLCGRLAELIIGSAHLPQALRRTPATWCGPPGCAKGPGIHHSQPEAGGPAHRTNRSERGSRVDLFLVADLVLVDALLLMRAASRRRAGGGQAGGRADFKRSLDIGNPRVFFLKKNGAAPGGANSRRPLRGPSGRTPAPIRNPRRPLPGYYPLIGLLRTGP